MTIDIEQLDALTEGLLPGLIGVKFLEAEPGRIRAKLDVRRDHLAPNGFLHAGTVVAFADTACGFGAAISIPQGMKGWTTIELKTNFLGTALEGTIECEATLVHGGRTTQVWDATVTDPGRGKTLALFRCTQLLFSG